MSLKSRKMDNFFGFDIQLPALGADKQDEVLLTADVDEDEYDALNDETFGDGGLSDGDWEENHEKLAELDMKILQNQNHDIEKEEMNNDPQQYIVEKSISQLGLDDLDDPAIMVHGRSHPQETIPIKYEYSPFNSTVSPVVHRLEDLEKDLLNCTEDHQKSIPIIKNHPFSNQQDRTLNNILNSPTHHWIYSQSEDIKENEKWVYSSSLPASNIKTVDEIEKDLFLKPKAYTVDDIEYQNKKLLGSPKNSRSKQPPIGTPPQGSNIISPVRLQSINRSPGTSVPFLGRTSPIIPPPQLGPQLPRFPSHTVVCPPRMISPFSLQFHPSRYMSAVGKNGRIRTPFAPCNFRPRDENSLDASMAQNLALQHYVKQHQQQNMINWMSRQPNTENTRQFLNDSEDTYDGLMTAKEKEWLIKIQMRQLQSDNPYLDDYYYTTFMTQKTVREKKENGIKLSSEPKVLLPERTKHETRTYVPAQFEGSLGKLQVASVNNPRKILDLGVCRPGEEEESKSANSHRFRYLLLNIEKLYTMFLEIEDEDKHILALPEQAQLPHQKTRQELIDKLFSGFMRDGNNSSDDGLVHILSVRKGRNLAMRSLHYFNLNNQVTLLISLFKCLSIVLRKDQHDLVLLQNCEMVLDIIDNLEFDLIVVLGEAIQNVSDQGKEKSNYSIALQTKFGTAVVCNLLKRAEYHMQKSDVNDDLRNRWEVVIVHIVNILCLLPENLMSEVQTSTEDIITHLERFSLDEDKFAVLMKKLNV